MNDARVIDVDPDITEAQFLAYLRVQRSPALNEARVVYWECVKRRVSPALILGIFTRESGCGQRGTATQTHSWGNTRRPSFGVPDIGTIQGRSGAFSQYADWAAGGISTVARLTEHAPYAGKRTVRQIIPVWAPSTDGNETEGYIAGVLLTMAALGAKGGAMVSKPPIVDHPSPNHGYPGQDYRPEAIVWHISEGSEASAINWLSSPASQASSNYVVGRQGTITCLVDPHNGPDGAAWANGQLNQPDLTNPLIAAWVAGKVNPNRRTISIESAGESTKGRPGALEAAQVAALQRLTAWLCQEFHIPADRRHIIRHGQIDSQTRANCPGFSEAAEMLPWISQIAGLVATPLPPAPTDPAESITSGIDPDGVPFVRVRFGGQAGRVLGVNAADLGISVEGVPDGVYDRSIQGGTFQPWTRRP